MNSVLEFRVPKFSDFSILKDIKSHIPSEKSLGLTKTCVIDHDISLYHQKSSYSKINHSPNRPKIASQISKLLIQKNGLHKKS